MRDQTVDDFLGLRNIEEVKIAPNGRIVGSIVSENFREYRKKEFRKTVYVFDEKFNILVKYEGYGLHSLSFSRDGSAVFAEGNEIVVLNQSGMPIKYDTGMEVSSIGFMSGKLVFTGTARTKKKEDDAYFFEEEDPFTNLYVMDSSGITKITDNLQIWEFSSSEGVIYAIASECPQESCWYASKVYRIVPGKDPEIIYDPGRRQIGKITTDGKRSAFLESVMSDRGVISGDIILYDGSARNITDGSAYSYSHVILSDNTIFALENEKTTFRIRNLDNGKMIWSGTGAVYPVYSPSFDHVSDAFAFAFSSPSDPPEIHLLKNAETKSSINSHLNEVSRYPAEIVEWKARDGEDLYGILRVLDPKNPLIVYIHGGPTSFSYASFLDRTSVYLGYGFNVFAPNYRGSVGRGRRYAELNVGDLGGRDFEDVISGIEFLKNTGKIATDRIYITGGSYGGYMSALAVMKTDLFRASVSLFGISDWVSFHGVSNLYLWDRLHMDADPWSFKKYDEYSPIRMRHEPKTPTLLMHGVRDPYVPIGQYYEFYRFLKEKDCEVRMIVFPREGHGFTEKEHIRRQYMETIRFMRDH